MPSNYSEKIRKVSKNLNSHFERLVTVGSGKELSRLTSLQSPIEVGTWGKEKKRMKEKEVGDDGKREENPPVQVEAPSSSMINLARFRQIKQKLTSFKIKPIRRNVPPALMMRSRTSTKLKLRYVAEHMTDSDISNVVVRSGANQKMMEDPFGGPPSDRDPLK
ncbi:hypothetical protein CLIB1423_08S02806 [[Candida] railenensis]|uniref:Uncharacterized protein n=1 Tax=[Candida] railenensis TaxID=45579 RepID=A0A9P0QR48_9ASCO|nr:hypothetical protein CLIB1423_08S02806 [[Candida] railenensis]